MAHIFGESEINVTFHSYKTGKGFARMILSPSRSPSARDNHLSHSPLPSGRDWTCHQVYNYHHKLRAGGRHADEATRSCQLRGPNRVQGPRRRQAHTPPGTVLAKGQTDLVTSFFSFPSQRDMFLIFRNLCRISTRRPEANYDQAQEIRSKILSLELLLSLMKDVPPSFFAIDKAMQAIRALTLYLFILSLS